MTAITKTTRQKLEIALDQFGTYAAVVEELRRHKPFDRVYRSTIYRWLNSTKRSRHAGLAIAILEKGAKKRLEPAARTGRFHQLRSLKRIYADLTRLRTQVKRLIKENLRIENID
ncbi:MAG: hypothetical protein Q7K35_02830 [bacterium]|nr:hypothetical protein [bacterium]